MFISFWKVLFLFNILYCVFGALPEHSIATSSDDCLSNALGTQTLLCRGKRALRNMLYNLNKLDRPIVIVRGLEIVPAKGVTPTDNKFVVDADMSDESMFDRFSDYLRTHELNIKFSDLLAEESERNLARDMEQNDIKSSVVEGRKKDKGQGGVLLAMALMFAKLLAVMGLGGIGAIALKALGVSMAALLMAGILGLKTLSQHSEHETSKVQYITADGGHHHKRRRRRSIALDDMTLYNNDKYPLFYRAWQHKSTT